jgi:Putative metallopeptidase
MKLPALIAFVSSTLPFWAYGATVEVDAHFQGATKFEVIVPPSQLKVVGLGLLKTGDQIAIQIDAANSVYNDITACITTEAEARAYTPRSPCRGQVKGKTPIRIRDQASSDAAYYLVLDNTYAAVIKKPISGTIITRKALSLEEKQQIKNGFQSVQSNMASTYEKSDFNILVKPCGQSNAFSNNRTADITICSEFIHDMVMQNNNGAMVAVLLHEYGHSLLNRWGEPGSSEEDMADQFATVLLLREGDIGRRFLQEWIAFWQRRDSQAEAQNQIRRGDTHTLSIQRARNIQNAMNFPEDLVRRWNKMLYRHMTRDALANVIAKPTKADDIELAKEAIRLK